MLKSCSLFVVAFQVEKDFTFWQLPQLYKRTFNSSAPVALLSPLSLKGHLMRELVTREGIFESIGPW